MFIFVRSNGRSNKYPYRFHPYLQDIIAYPLRFVVLLTDGPENDMIRDNVYTPSPSFFYNKHEKEKKNRTPLRCLQRERIWRRPAAGAIADMCPASDLDHQLTLSLPAGWTAAATSGRARPGLAPRAPVHTSSPNQNLEQITLKSQTTPRTNVPPELYQWPTRASLQIGEGEPPMRLNVAERGNSQKNSRSLPTSSRNADSFRVCTCGSHPSVPC